MGHPIHGLSFGVGALGNPLFVDLAAMANGDDECYETILLEFADDSLFSIVQAKISLHLFKRQPLSGIFEAFRSDRDVVQPIQTGLNRFAKEDRLWSRQRDACSICSAAI